MKNVILINKYARALHEVAESQSVTEKVFNAFVGVEELYGNSGFSQFINFPALSDSRKIEIIREILPDFLWPKCLENLLLHLIVTGNYDLLPDILQEFRNLCRKGEMDVQVVTADKMTTEQLQKLVEVLQVQFDKVVNVQVTEDETLIFGMRIFIGNYLFDTSLFSYLRLLQDRLQF